MKTGELIALLKKEDPDNECHVRLDTGAPYHVERKPGYYDGCYTYEEDGKFIVSTEGDKVDIYSRDLETWVLDTESDNSSVVVNLPGYSDGSRVEKDIRAKVDKVLSEIRKVEKQQNAIALDNILSKLNNGWKIQGHDLGSLRFVRGDGEARISLGEEEVLKNSGYFKKTATGYKLSLGD